MNVLHPPWKQSLKHQRFPWSLFGGGIASRGECPYFKSAEGFRVRPRQ